MHVLYFLVYLFAYVVLFCQGCSIRITWKTWWSNSHWLLIWLSCWPGRILVKHMHFVLPLPFFFFFHVDKNVAFLPFLVLKVADCDSGCMEFARRIHWLHWLGSWDYLFTVLVRIIPSFMTMIWKGTDISFLYWMNLVIYFCCTSIINWWL